MTPPRPFKRPAFQLVTLLFVVTGFTSIDREPLEAPGLDNGHGVCFHKPGRLRVTAEGDHAGQAAHRFQIRVRMKTLPWNARCRETQYCSPMIQVTLLLIAGVEPNPGPVRNPCGTCLRPIAKTHRSLMCAECCTIRHIKCAKVSPTEYKLLRGRSWTCSSCLVPTANDESRDCDAPSSDLDEDSGLEDLPSNPFNLQTPKGLCLANINIDGLRSCFDSFMLSLMGSNIDCLGVCETNLVPGVPDNQVQVPGYQAERKDATTRLTHGILLYVKENLNIRRRSDLEEADLDALWCEVRLPKSKPLLLGSVYRSPSSLVEHQDRLKSNIDRAMAEGFETFILGDINHDLLCTGKAKTSQNKDFQQSMNSLGLKQIINSPTRVTEDSKTLIDHAYVNISQNIVSSGVASTGLSDHRLVYIVRKATKPRLPPRTITARCYRGFDDEEYDDDLSAIPWTSVESFDSPEDAWGQFKTLLLDLENRHAPLKTRTVRGRPSPWVTPDLISQTWERDHLKRIAEKHGDPLAWDRYRKARNACTRSNDKLKEDYFKNRVEENSQDSSKLWATLKQLLSSSSKSSNIQTVEVDGVEVSDTTSIANYFNTFFSTIGAKLAERFKRRNTTILSNRYK